MNIRRDNGSATLDVTREDLSHILPTLAMLEQQLRDECAQVITVNLEQIESIYSLQIGTLAAMHVMCYENLAVMKLSNVCSHVRDQLTLVGLDKMMEMHHGASVAKESFKK